MINIDQARDLLRRAVETQGRDFVYNPGGNGYCSYNVLAPDAKFLGGVAEGSRITPCLIGVALDLAGETRHHRHNVTVEVLSFTFPDMLSHAAMRYLHTAQLVQDSGNSWGKAFDVAEDWYHHRTFA